MTIPTPVQVQPRRLNYLRNSAFIVKLDPADPGADYAGSCRRVRAEPAGAAASFYGMKPSATYSETAGWELTLEFADDYDALDSLSTLMFEHDGEQATVQFWPNADGVGFETTLTLKSGGIGGTTREVATSTVTLECSKPVRIPDPTPEPAEG